jgi:hypothetical protein
MSRWLLLSSCMLVLAAVGSLEPTRSAGARGLGGQCGRDRDCQSGLICSTDADVMDGQCTASCNSSAACAERFGVASECLGADVCAQTCKTDRDCASGSACNEYNWCDRPKP